MKSQLVPLDQAQKGDRVSLTYQGEEVTAKVVRRKKDGTLTVDVENHSNQDVGYVDIRTSKKEST
jgi:hypothetical protein